MSVDKENKKLEKFKIINEFLQSILWSSDRELSPIIDEKCGFRRWNIYRDSWEMMLPKMSLKRTIFEEIE